MLTAVWKDGLLLYPHFFKKVSPTWVDGCTSKPTMYVQKILIELEQLLVVDSCELASAGAST